MIGSGRRIFSLSNCAGLSGRRHKFRSHWIFDSTSDDPIDLAHCFAIELPLHHVANRVELPWMPRAPKCFGYAGLIELEPTLKN
jgi:hypothetical protein